MIRAYVECIYAATVRRADRFFATDSTFLLGGGVWNVTARIASSALLFGVSILYARYLPKELYGSYRYVWSLLGMMSFLTFTDILTALSRAAARGKEHLYRAEAKWYFILTFPLALFSIGTGFYFLSQHNVLFGVAFLAAGVLTPLRDGITIFYAWLILNRKFKLKAEITIVENISSLLAMAASVFLISRYDIAPLYALPILLIAYSLGHGVPRLFYAMRIAQRIPRGPDEPLKPIAKFGLHLGASNILPTIAGYLDGVLVFSFLGAPALAVYSFAILIPEQAKALLGTVAGIAQPKIFSKDDEAIKLLPGKLLRATLVVGAGVIAYILLAPFVFGAFFPRYVEAVPFSRVFMLSTLSVPLAVLGSAVIAQKATKRLYFYRTAGPLLQIGLIAVLVPLFGLWGAVWARVVGRMLKSGLLLAMFTWYHPRR